MFFLDKKSRMRIEVRRPPSFKFQLDLNQNRFRFQVVHFVYRKCGFSFLKSAQY